MSSDGGFLAGPEPRLFAHRGASADAPENTLEAFQVAWEEGAPYLEMDVRSSADGAVMVIHDASVSRTTGRRGRVENMTFEDIRRLDAGYTFTPDHGRTFPYRGKGISIPTLEEVFDAFPKARLNIEIKPSRAGVERAVLDVIRRYGAEDRVFVAAHEHELIEKFRALDGDVLTGFSKKEVRDFLSRVKGKDFVGYRPQGKALQVPEYFGLRRVLSPAFIDAAHRLEREVHVWTVNQPLRMKRLLGWGVDGIMTDDPARAFDSVEVLGTSARLSRDSRS
jgi:glycerophosphoryl diester phosphodiesterase